VTLEDLTVAPVATELLACLDSALDELGEAKPAHVGMRVGQTVALMLSTSQDECCEGLGWVRVAQVYPSTSFPAPDEVPFPGFGDPERRAVVLEMGVARCAPTPPAEEIPSDDQWNELSDQILNDAAAMRKAVCCFAALDDRRLYLEGSWLPLDVEGGCAGGTLAIIVALRNCDC
jgi:hypothetical protein